MRKIFIALLALTCVIFVTSCDVLESDNNFRGGELLDEGLLSEIRSELEISETTEKEIETKTEETTDNTSDSLESITEESSLPTTSAGSSGSGKTVYWTESGGRWHLYEDCGSLKNSKNIISGTEEEAIEAGKEKICSYCDKRDD